MMFARLVALIFVLLGCISVLKNSAFAAGISGSYLPLALGSIAVLIMLATYSKSWLPRPSEQTEAVSDDTCWLCDKTMPSSAASCPHCGVDQNIVPISSTKPFTYIDLRTYGGQDKSFRNCICCLRESKRNLTFQPLVSDVYVEAPYCFACRLRFKFAKFFFFIGLWVAWFLFVVVAGQSFGLQGWWGTAWFFGSSAVLLFLLSRFKVPSVALRGHSPLCVAITNVSDHITDGQKKYVRQFRFGNKAVAERLRHWFGDGTQWQRTFFAASSAKTEAEWQRALEAAAERRAELRAASAKSKSRP